MSSILTNESAMTALMTLRTINTNLGTLQESLGTGKKVSSARSNAAVWAISKTMQSDVAGFKQLSASLALGQSTVSVGRQAAQAVTGLLTDMKGKIVAAQEYNVDRGKIQSDINALRDQIGAVVGAAQFNGLNLISNTSSTAGEGSINVLSSLVRSGSDVTSEDITVRKRDLSYSASVISAASGTFTADAVTATLNATQTITLDASGLTVEVGAAFSISIFGTDADGSSFTQADLRTTAGASQTQAEMAAGDMSYVARDGDTMTDVLSALVTRFKGVAGERGFGANVLSMSVSGSSLIATSEVTTATDDIIVSLNTLGADAGNTVGGRLEQLNDIDVTTNAGADKAMGVIDGLIEEAINASAALGSDQGRMEIQQSFVQDMSDTLRSGIGTMVDANLTESSARLQALQVQQQLAVQALSIANQSPQSLLSLFR